MDARQSNRAMEKVLYLPGMDGLYILGTLRQRPFAEAGHDAGNAAFSVEITP